MEECPVDATITRTRRLSNTKNILTFLTSLSAHADIVDTAPSHNVIVSRDNRTTLIQARRRAGGFRHYFVTCALRTALVYSQVNAMAFAVKTAVRVNQMVCMLFTIGASQFDGRSRTRC